MLRKAIYGLKNGARIWYETVVKVVTNGWKQQQIRPDIICMEKNKEKHWYYGDACR